MQNHIIFDSLEKLPDVGEKTKAQLTTLLRRILDRKDIKIIDILHNVPRYYIDRRKLDLVGFASLNKISTFKVEIIKIIKPKRRNLPTTVICRDDSGIINLQFFTKYNSWINKQFKINDKIIISGKTSLYKNQLNMTHPDYMLPIELEHLIPKIEPVYSLSSGISNKVYQKHVSSAIDLLPDFDEWIDENILQKCNFLSHKQALTQIHKPLSMDLNAAFERLAYDELLAQQVALKLIKCKKTSNASALTLGNNIQKKIEALLPFTLTNEQVKAFERIKTYLSNPQPMSCLLQGDVGCGKTIVAALAMAQMASLNFQCTIMAPTEVLARQHYEKLKPIFDQLNIHSVILTRNEKGKEKTQIIKAIKNGEAKIVIGTHALLSDNIIFKNLALTIIDEQHRFGVEQRATLLNKNIISNLLIMTATPIPRTLVLTEFGETDVVHIKQKPKERLPIVTKMLPITKLDKLIDRIKIILKSKAKIYWICPLIEESETLELMNALNRYQYLTNIFEDKVGLIHGKQSISEKEKVIDNFKKTNIQILVSTTVIEVGIDIPDATIMIIEHAERFGLSQLHQLRGRVGRSNKASSCILLYKEPLSSVAQQRLNIMINSEDGFYIAEKDLELRGEGELFGNKQSGAINFIFANLAKHLFLLEYARKNAINFSMQDLSLLKIYSTVTDLAKLRG